MNGPARRPRGLYYPFHLCSAQTLDRLLADYDVIYFREYMAVQLTPLSGTTAYPDRMGQYYPDLLQAGRIADGLAVGRTFSREIEMAIDRDLADAAWRSLFHQGLKHDKRFQRGLFDITHSMSVAGKPMPGPALLLRLFEDAWMTRRWSVEVVRALSRPSDNLDQGLAYEYGFALVKTAAAQAHTIRLCRELTAEAVTDSRVHFELLKHTCSREALTLSNRLSEA
jgi:hypothetical protein